MAEHILKEPLKRSMIMWQKTNVSGSVRSPFPSIVPPDPGWEWLMQMCDYIYLVMRGNILLKTAI